MQKIRALIICAACILALAGTAHAGAAKPPKSLCVWSGVPGGPALSLGIKKGNKIEFGASKSNMFTVQGLGVYGGLRPVCGTGYMSGENFVFYLSTASDGTHYTMLGMWNVVAEGGTLDINESTPGGLTSESYTLLPIACDMF